jgi:hypothetical protein
MNQKTKKLLRGYAAKRGMPIRELTEVWLETPPPKRLELKRMMRRALAEGA